MVFIYVSPIQTETTTKKEQFIIYNIVNVSITIGWSVSLGPSEVPFLIVTVAIIIFLI